MIKMGDKKFFPFILYFLLILNLFSFNFFRSKKIEEIYPISSEYFRLSLEKVKKEKVKIPEGVLILPLLDNQGKLNSLGSFISILSTYKFMYLPEKKLNVLMPHLEQIFYNKKFFEDSKTSHFFHTKEIEELMRDLRVNSYVRGFLVNNNKSYHIELRFEGIKGSLNIGKDGNIEDLIYLPSWIAEKVYEYLGIKLSKEKKEFIRKVDFFNWKDLIEASNLENLYFKDIYQRTPEEDKKVLNTYKKLYSKNPDSIFLIIRYINSLWQNHYDEEMLEILEKAIKKYPDCERILLCYCHILNLKAYEPCGYDKTIVPILMKLLKTEYLNNKVYSILNGIYKPYNLWEELKMLYDFWVTNDPNYFLPYQERGKFYYGFAWYARGSGWASQVSKEGWKKYYYRLNLAEKDLYKAISLNPEAYDAYRYLVKIGYELNRSNDYIECFYNKAIELQPNDPRIYMEKFDKIQPKWGGSLEEMYDYLEELFEKKFEKDISDSIIANLFNYFKISKISDEEYYYQRNEIWEKVKQLYEKYISKNPNAILTKYVVLKMAYMRNEFKYAKKILDSLGSYDDNSFLDNFEEFINIKKKTIMVLNNIKEIDAYKILIDEYKKWIEKEPKKEFNYIILAYLFNRIKDYKNAENYISKAENLNLHIPEISFVKGLIYFDKGENEKAKECFRNAFLKREYCLYDMYTLMRFDYFLSWYNKI